MQYIFSQISGGEQRKNGGKTIFEGVKVEKFPELMKNFNS